MPSFATSPIHYGGDNLGEQEPDAPIRVLPVYRKHLHFWNNTVVFRATQAQAWRLNIFDLSLVSTTVDAWSNVFVLDSGTSGATPPELSWVQNAGVLNLRGANLTAGTIIKAAYGAYPSMHAVNTGNGILVTGDPLFVDMAKQDFRLMARSATIDRAGAVPTGLPPSLATTYPLLGQARVGANVGTDFLANGWVSRTQQGTAMDLGAIEYGP